jgi:hypothetical protein
MTRVQMAAQTESVSGPHATLMRLLGAGRPRADTARSLAGDCRFLGLVDIRGIN